jgi:hypothetical protein
MKKIVFVLLVGAVSLFACNSDYDCGYGEKCVKKYYSYQGQCMKSNSDKDMNSIWGGGYNNNQHSTSCPIGYSYDYSYNKCIRYY